MPGSAREITLPSSSSSSSPTCPSPPDFFTCTYCFQLSSGTPHVLGHSARLVCTPCHTAILDLAICWVCGHLIFRGNECVSLGWCFWHRACYGCLLCGSRMVRRGVGVKELFSREKGGAVEVGEVPLCRNCAAEVEMDGLDGGGVVRRGLGRVDNVDGGVTRKRWEWKKGDDGEADGIDGEILAANREEHYTASAADSTI